MTLYNEIPQRVNEIKTKFPVENEMLLLRHFAIRAIIMNRDEDDEVYHIKSKLINYMHGSARRINYYVVSV